MMPVLTELPPPNADAFGLCLTSAELDSLRRILSGMPDVAAAYVYGSRLTGIRRPKVPATPLDIDLAIELTACKSEERFAKIFFICEDLKSADGLVIDAWDRDDASSPHYCARQKGVEIYRRTGTSE